MSTLPIQFCPRDTLAGILPLPNELCDKIHWFTKGKGPKDEVHKELSTVGSIWRVPSYRLISLLEDRGAVQNGSDLEIHKNGYSIIESEIEPGVRTLYISNPHIRLYATYLLNNHPVVINTFRNFIEHRIEDEEEFHDDEEEYDRLQEDFDRLQEDFVRLQEDFDRLQERDQVVYEDF